MPGSRRPITLAFPLIPSLQTPPLRFGSVGPCLTLRARAQVACVSLCWSADGNWLYSGYTDGAIRVWGVSVR